MKYPGKPDGRKYEKIADCIIVWSLIFMYLRGGGAEYGAKRRAGNFPAGRA